jgi:hypothetical protein
MRNDILFFSTSDKEQLDMVGPGYYYPSGESPLIRKSFNVRASKKLDPRKRTSYGNNSQPPFHSGDSIPLSPIQKRNAYVTPVRRKEG